LHSSKKMLLVPGIIGTLICSKDFRCVLAFSFDVQSTVQLRRKPPPRVGGPGTRKFKRPSEQNLKEAAPRTVLKMISCSTKILAKEMSRESSPRNLPADIPQRMPDPLGPTRYSQRTTLVECDMQQTKQKAQFSRAQDGETLGKVKKRRLIQFRSLDMIYY